MSMFVEETDLYEGPRFPGYEYLSSSPEVNVMVKSEARSPTIVLNHLPDLLGRRTVRSTTTREVVSFQPQLSARSHVGTDLTLPDDIEHVISRHPRSGFISVSHDVSRKLERSPDNLNTTNEETHIEEPPSRDIVRKRLLADPELSAERSRALDKLQKIARKIKFGAPDQTDRLRELRRFAESLAEKTEKTADQLFQEYRRKASKWQKRATQTSILAPAEGSNSGEAITEGAAEVIREVESSGTVLKDITSVKKRKTKKSDRGAALATDRIKRSKKKEVEKSRNRSPSGSVETSIPEAEDPSTDEQPERRAKRSEPTKRKLKRSRDQALTVIVDNTISQAEDLAANERPRKKAKRKVAIQKKTKRSSDQTLPDPLETSIPEISDPSADEQPKKRTKLPERPKKDQISSKRTSNRKEDKADRVSEVASDSPSGKADGLQNPQQDPEPPNPARDRAKAIRRAEKAILRLKGVVESGKRVDLTQRIAAETRVKPLAQVLGRDPKLLFIELTPFLDKSS
jgi:hypothetical protein